MNGKPTPFLIQTTFTLIKHFTKIYRSQGRKGLVKRLKAYSILLQQCSAHFILKDVSSIGPRIARRGGGFPAVIPVEYRILIKKENLKGVFILKYFLTIFSIYRNIFLPINSKLNTITDLGPVRVDVPVIWIRNFIKLFIPH
jgi:hypothetical protein